MADDEQKDVTIGVPAADAGGESPDEPAPAEPDDDGKDDE
jgi:hypothetical protein